MFKDFKYDGVWFLPEKPDEKFHGTLTYDCAEGTELSLNGCFKPLHNFNKDNVVLGECGGAPRITLLGCTYKKPAEHGMDSSIYYYGAESTLIGAHFPERAAIKFKALKVQDLNTRSWLGETTSYNNGNIRHAFDPVHVASLEDVNIEILPGVGGGDRPYLIIKASVAEAHNILRAISDRFHDLLSLATGTPVVATDICGFVDENTEVKIYHAPRYSGKPVIILRDDMVFTFDDISRNSQAVFTSWFNSWKEIEAVHELYFSNLCRPAPYPRARFLSYVQALEVYHRQMIMKKNLPILINEFEARKKRMYSTMNPEDKKWFHKRMNYGYEPTQRDRLKEILDLLPVPFALEKKQRDNLVGVIVSTRNYYVHLDQSSMEGVVTDEHKIWHLAQRLKMLVEVLLLNELGFDEQTRTKVFENLNNRYSYLKEVVDPPTSKDSGDAQETSAHTG